MPSEIQTSKTFFLISGIVNILILLGWSGGTIISGLVTCGVGCLIGFIPLLNLAACIMDFLTYNKLNSLDRGGTFNSMQVAAILDIVTIITGNIISLVFGIVILSYLNNEKLISYLKEKGIY